MSNPIDEQVAKELRKALTLWREEVFRDGIVGYNKHRQTILPAKPIQKEKRK